MKNISKKIVVLMLVVCMTIGMFIFPANAEETNEPVVSIGLVSGGSTSATGSVTNDGIKIIRIINANMSEIEAVINKRENVNVKGILPSLKFDRNDAADQKQQKLDRELYTDNGHFHDPDTFLVSDAPAGYPFKYVGHGDYSGHYVSHIRVIYEKDEAGNALKDENGNYIIKELQHVSSGTPLHYNGSLSTNVQGPFHYATGTRPQQFLLKNEQGELVYAYCIDVVTAAVGNKWYALANIEDNDYYASEEAENHIRNIVKYGYWGTAEGTGSLASLKAALKTAVANGVVDKEYDVNFVNRKTFTAGYELKEGEYHYGNYVYWNVPFAEGENHVVLTDDVIDGLTEGEALDAMQMAIWSYANGAQATLNGKDGVIVGDPYAASSQLSDSLHGKNDWAGAARTKALYNYLLGLDEELDSTVVINDNTFAENMSLTVGKKIADGIYEAKLNFSLAAVLGEQDNLTVKLTYVDAYGETQTIELPLTGEGALVAENGFYSIDGLNLKVGEAFDFSLNIYGGQFLEQGAYILTSEGGTSASQTMVTYAEGMNIIDLTKGASIIFNVEEHRINGVGVKLQGVKYLDEEVYGGFDFAISDKDGIFQQVESNANGIFEFDTLVFTEAGEYVYTIHEIADENNEDIYYDESIYTVKVTVTLTDYTLEARVTAFKDGEVHEDEIRFDNLTIPDIPDNPPPLDPPKTGENTIGFIILAVAAMMMSMVLATKKRMA